MNNGSDLRAALERLLADREEKAAEVQKLDNAIEALQRILGEEIEVSGIEESSTKAVPITRREAPKQLGAISIRPDQFFGMSQTGAAEAYLKMVGHAVHIDQIMDALRRGGIAIGGSDPQRNLYTQLVRGTRKFVLVSANTFGLREFYPNLPKKDKKTTAEKAKRRKSERKRKRMEAKNKVTKISETKQKEQGGKAVHVSGQPRRVITRDEEESETKRDAEKAK